MNPCLWPQVKRRIRRGRPLLLQTSWQRTRAAVAAALPLVSQQQHPRQPAGLTKLMIWMEMVSIKWSSVSRLFRKLTFWLDSRPLMSLKYCAVIVLHKS